MRVEAGDGVSHFHFLVLGTNGGLRLHAARDAAKHRRSANDLKAKRSMAPSGHTIMNNSSMTSPRAGDFYDVSVDAMR